MLNAHKVFFEAPDRCDFLAKLNVDDEMLRALADARDLIRAELRSGFAQWQEKLDRRLVLNEAALRKSLPDPKLRPKFRMQGSASYHTLNDPAHRPPQKIDYDDGVYLPVSFLAETRDPVLASAGYFRLVETILAPLCQRQRWTLYTDKSSCVRVVLSATAHIDLPLYAIPDEAFRTLAEQDAIMKTFSDRAAMADSIELRDGIYRGLSQEEMRLAHREQGWILSDPRLIEDWFKGAIDDHGYQLRRVCRYLKAWRDHHWGKCNLTSITIMKCVVDAFDSLKGQLDQKRDDFALLKVSAQLDQYFSGDIRNPVIDAVLNDNWTAEDRDAFRLAAVDLHSRLQVAVLGSRDVKAALLQLTVAFGPRLPQDPSLISPTAAATVKSYEPEKMPAPYVPKTTSG